MKKINVTGGVICTIMLALLAPYFLAAWNIYAAVALSVICALTSLILFRGTRFIVFTLVFEGVLFLTLGFQLFALFVSFLLFSAISAAFICIKKDGCVSRGAISAICSIAGGAITYALTQDITATLLTLAPLAIAFTIAAGVRRKLPRTQAIALVTVVLIIPVVALAALLIYETKGGLSVEIIKESINSVRTSMADFLASIKYSDILTISAESEEGAKYIFSKADALTVVTSVMNMIPGFAVAGLSIAAFFIQRFALSLIVLAECKEDEGYSQEISAPSITEEMATLRMSFVSAVFFAFAALANIILSAIGGDDLSMIASVFQTLFIALLPAFVGTGAVIYLKKRRASRSSGVGFFIILSIFVFPYVLLSIAAYYGTICVIVDELKDYLKSKKKS